MRIQIPDRVAVIEEFMLDMVSSAKKWISILRQPKLIKREKMKITSLEDNESTLPVFLVEYGLSLYIETQHHKMLFDLGQGSLFLQMRNAWVLTSTKSILLSYRMDIIIIGEAYRPSVKSIRSQRFI